MPKGKKPFSILKDEQVPQLLKQTETIGELIIQNESRDDFRLFLRNIHSLSDWALQSEENSEGEALDSIDPYAPVQRRIVERSLNRLNQRLKEDGDRSLQLSDLVDTVQRELDILLSLKKKI